MLKLCRIFAGQLREMVAQYIGDVNVYVEGKQSTLERTFENLSERSEVSLI